MWRLGQDLQTVGNSGQERRLLLTSLDKTDIDMLNRSNPGFTERKRSIDKEWSYKQEVTSCADIPSSEFFKSSNQFNGSFRRRPLTKGLTHDVAQLRKDNLVPGLPCADAAPQLLRNINRRSMLNPKDETALLNHGAVNGKLPLTQKCWEIELDEALANLHNMTAERDSLAEQLRVSQEQAKSEHMYLMQRVKELQATILKLDAERCDFINRQSVNEEQALDLEKQIQTYSCQLVQAEEELKRSQMELISSVRELKVKSGNALSESQCKLVTKVRELQSVLERNEQLEQKSDTLFEQLNDLRNGIYSLESLTFQLNQDKQSLQEELEKKDKLNGSLNVKVEKLETATKSLQEEASRENRELDAVQRKLADAQGQLNALLMEKDAMFQANADLQDDLDNVHLDNRALQRKVEGSSQDLELLQRKIQDFMSESSCSKMMLSTKEEVIENLKYTVKDLETSVKSRQQEVNRGIIEMDAVQRKLADTEKQLNAVMKEKEAQLKANLQGDRYQAMEYRVEGSSQEVGLLQRKLHDFMTESSYMERMLWSKEEIIDDLELTIEELETSTKSLQQEVSRGNKELEDMQGKLTDQERELNAVVKEKEALVKANTDFQGGFDRVQLGNQEQVIETLQQKIRELETSVKSLQVALAEKDCELDTMRKKLANTDKELNSMEKEKEATLREHSTLRDDLNTIQLDNQALQLKVEGSSQDGLQKKLQECMTESSYLKILLSSKEDVIEHLQVTVKELRAKSLQQEASREIGELDALQRKLRDAKENLDTVLKEKVVVLKENADLKDVLTKLQLENQALQRKVEGPCQEVAVLQKKLQDFMTENSCSGILLSSKDEVIGRLRLTVKELEESVKSLQQAVNRGSSELDAMQKKLRDTERSVDTLVGEKEAVLKENADLKGVFTKVQLESQALLRKVEGPSQELEFLQKKLQDCMSDSVSAGILLSSQDEVIGRLRLTVKELEESAKSLQQAVNRGNSELDAVQKKLSDTERSLDILVGEKEVVIKENADLKGHLDKRNLDNQNLQRKVDGSSQEMELLRKTLQDYMTENTHTKILLSSKEDFNEHMHLRLQELETSAKSLKQAVSEREWALDAMQKALTDTEKKLDISVTEKNAMLQANARVRIDFDRLRLDNETLQRKVEGSSQEIELLQKKLQDYTTEISQNNLLLSSKEEAIESLQLAVMKLEISTKVLQQEVGVGSRELDTIQKKLTDTEQNLSSVVREKDSVLKENTDLRDTLEKIQLDNQGEGLSQEVELLQRKLQDHASKMSRVNEQLSFKDQVIENLQLTVKELETSMKDLQQSANRAEKQFEFAQKRVSNTEEILSALMKEKETTQKENLNLRDELYSMHSGNQAMQRKTEGSNQEVELLQMELQDFSTDVNILQSWVSSSEAAIARLLTTFEGLDPSVECLQRAENTGEKDLDAMGSESGELGPSVQKEGSSQETSSNS